MITIIIGLFALIMGSFLNVVIYRLPKMMMQPAKTPFNLALPGSHCPHCKAPLRFWHNIPLVSFIWQRGRCHQCQQRIHWRYPLVEIITLVLTLILFFSVGLNLILIPLLALVYALIALTFIDLEHQILPDCITLPLLWSGLLCNSVNVITTSASAIWGAAAGFLSLWLINKFYVMIRKHPGIGMGDCKLLAALGAWLGIQALIPILLIASVLGLFLAVVLIAAKRFKYDTPLPFGPFLAIAALGYLLKVI